MCYCIGIPPVVEHFKTICKSLSAFSFIVFRFWKSNCSRYLEICLPVQAMLARYVLWSSVCLSVCHKPEFHQNGWLYWAGFWHRDYRWFYPTLCFKGIWMSLIIRVLYSGILSQTDLSQFSAFLPWPIDRHGMSSITRHLSSTVASLSEWASTFVYNIVSYRAWHGSSVAAEICWSASYIDRLNKWLEWEQFADN